MANKLKNLLISIYRHAGFHICEECNLSEIGILVIDTEGFDFEIVKYALAMRSPPSIIHFETIHLNRSDRLESRKILSSRHYCIIESETDTLAYQSSLFHPSESR